MSRPTVAIFSRDNLLHNFYHLKSLAPHAKVIAMVKANAYGHHIESVARILDTHTDSFGVAGIDEAIKLRSKGIKSDIFLVEGVFKPEELTIAAANRFPIVFHHKAQLDWLKEIPLPCPLMAWLKIDTGMGRLGFNVEELPEAHHLLSTTNKIMTPVGILSHFACADELMNPQNLQQIDVFTQAAQNYRGPKSLCNSAGIFNFPNQHLDYIRPGLALYGASPLIGKSAADLNLRPVMTFTTRVIAINIRQKNSSLGYGGRFVCPEDLPVGAIAVGYGDGYPRTAADGTPVLINDTICPIIGRVSMDIILVDLRNCPKVKVGDQVILWGEGLPIESVVPHTHNISYDLFTGLQTRVKKYWV